MSTLKEIAESTGVSTATVSRVLNKKPGVKAELRARVQAAIDQAGYSPNSAARALATSAQHTIGFLSLDREQPLAYDPFYHFILRGAEQELARHGYFVVVATVEPGWFDCPEELPVLREKRVDGLILPSAFFPETFPIKIKKLKIPLVLIDNLISDPPIDSVLADDENAGYIATRHLLAHGHQKLAVISGPRHWASNRLRVAGFNRAVDEAGLEAVTIYQPDTTIESGVSGTQKLLEDYKEVSAIFAVNDAIAVGALRTVQAAGLSVPDDLALVGVDDIELASHVSVPLTTMRIPKRRLGMMAARRLVEIINNPQDTPVILMAPVELILRNSCGCKGN